MSRQQQPITTNDSSLAFFFLCIYTAAVLIRPHEMFLGTREWIIVRIIIIITFIVTLFSQRPLKLSPQHWMLLALLPHIVISGFLNTSGMYGIEQAQALLVSAVLPFFIFSNLLSTIKRQHILMVICLLATIIMVHNGHFQQSSFNYTGWALDTVAVRSCSDCDNLQMRIAYLGFFGDPNDLGMFLVMCLPFTIYFHKRGGWFIKLIMKLQIVILIYGIYLTGSRGTFLGAGSLLAIYYLVVNAGPKLMIISAVLAPVAGVVISSLQSDIDDSAQGRLYAWYEGIQMLIANPIFGIGKGNFVEEHGLVAHNSYVQVAGELGIPGYSLWGGCLILTMLTSFLIIKAVQKQNTDELSDEIKEELALSKTLFFSLCGFAVTAFFITRSFTLLLFIFMAMSLASNIRVIKCLPELQFAISNSLIVKSMMYSWTVIVLVYISLKLTL